MNLTDCDDVSEDIQISTATLKQGFAVLIILVFVVGGSMAAGTLGAAAGGFAGTLTAIALGLVSVWLVVFLLVTAAAAGIIVTRGRS